MYPKLEEMSEMMDQVERVEKQNKNLRLFQFHNLSSKFSNNTSYSNKFYNYINTCIKKNKVKSWFLNRNFGIHLIFQKY